MQKDIFQEMADKWPSAIVARTEIAKFSGGLISAKYAANLDSLRQFAPRITIGRKVGYPVASLVAWLRTRSGN
jgi:hypothetical protein